MWFTAQIVKPTDTKWFWALWMNLISFVIQKESKHKPKKALPSRHLTELKRKSQVTAIELNILTEHVCRAPLIKFLSWQSSHRYPASCSRYQYFNRAKHKMNLIWAIIDPTQGCTYCSLCTINLMNTLLIFDRFYIGTKVISTCISSHQDRGWIIILLTRARCNERRSLRKTERPTPAANNGARGQGGNMKGN